jgi:hypothetical protein
MLKSWVRYRILRRSGIEGAADEAVFNKLINKKKTIYRGQAVKQTLNGKNSVFALELNELRLRFCWMTSSEDTNITKFDLNTVLISECPLNVCGVWEIASSIML